MFIPSEFNLNQSTRSIEGLDVWTIYEPGELAREPGWPILYRAHSDVCEGPYVRVWFSSYKVVGYTPTGVWIARGVAGKKFVSLKSFKQWASLTKEYAMRQLKRRKQAEVRILHNRLQCAEMMFNEVSEFLKD